MNKQPIEQALDSDLRLSKTALLRAAQRARTGDEHRHGHRGLS